MKLDLFLDCYGVLYINASELMVESNPKFSNEISDLVKSYQYGTITQADLLIGFDNFSNISRELVDSLLLNRLVVNSPLIEEIKARLLGLYNVYIFSNTTQQDLVDLCDVRVLDAISITGLYSSELVGVAKPSSESFLRVQQMAGVESSSCVLVDDLMQNVNGAKVAGWGGVYYDHVENVIKNLEEEYNARAT